MEIYQALEVTRKTGTERFQINGQELPIDLLSFWQWSSSDLVGNALRGLLAEYIVAIALSTNENTRTEWDAFDIETPNGIRVEVKSGAYIQSWSQKRLSTIQFGIQETKGWDAKTNTYSAERKRQSDVYVFCVLTHKDQDSINPLNLDQWDFFVISTTELTKAVGNQKTISLKKLLKIGLRAVKFGEIRKAVNYTISNSS